jgi:hypothetical protein
MSSMFSKKFHKKRKDRKPNVLSLIMKGKPNFAKDLCSRAWHGNTASRGQQPGDKRHFVTHFYKKIRNYSITYTKEK